MISTLKNVDENVIKQIEEEMKIRKTKEVFLLFGLGSQYDFLIKQQMEKLRVFCLVADPNSVTAEDVKKVKPKGIILSGGPVSVYKQPPKFDEEIFDLGIPVLGICLGFQMWAKHVGCMVEKAKKREYGKHECVIVDPLSLIFQDCPTPMTVLQSHGDIIVPNSELIEVLATTDNAPLAAGRRGDLYGLQFHPEVTHTKFGPQIFENFVFKICEAKDRFPVEDVAEQKILKLRKQIGDKKVLLAFSGGNDSVTTAYLLKEALRGNKEQLFLLYIKGLDRFDDEAYVLKYFSNQDWCTLIVVDGTDRFLEALKGKTGMHEKRMAMRPVYLEILEEEAKKLEVDFFAQGTLYTDICESGGGLDTGAEKAVIKVHHNPNLPFSKPEITPLDDCVKDMGRNIGLSIGVPEELLNKHPFPGPGLIVRIHGEITAEKLEMARQVDRIWLEELRNFKEYYNVWQAGAVVTESMVTVSKGDDKGMGNLICFWAVTSINGFTAEPARLSYDLLECVATRIGNEVEGVGAAYYRINGKPYGTIEHG